MNDKLGEEWAKLTISCSDPDSIVAAANAVMPKLPREECLLLNRIKLQLLQQYGKTGLFERFNNRTIASLLKEFAEDGAREPAVSGELDGVSYELSDDPMTEDEDL